MSRMMLCGGWDMSESMVLLHLGSVLVSQACVTTKSHVGVLGMDYHLKYYAELALPPTFSERDGPILCLGSPIELTTLVAGEQGSFPKGISSEDLASLLICHEVEWARKRYPPSFIPYNHVRQKG